MASVARQSFLTFLVLMSVVIPSPAWGCSVCFLAKKENLAAYFGTGVLLSVLPFLLIGGIGFWLYRQVKERARSFNAMREEDQ